MSKIKKGTRIVHQLYGSGIVHDLLPLKNGIIAYVNFDVQSKKIPNPRAVPVFQLIIDGQGRICE